MLAGRLLLGGVFPVAWCQARVVSENHPGTLALRCARLGGGTESAGERCYRPYTLCEGKKRADAASAWIGLVQSWPEITRLAGKCRAL